MNIIKVLSLSSIMLGISFATRFFITLILARFLSSDQLGIYSWSVTVFGMANLLVNFGLDYLLIRKIPQYVHSELGLVESVINHTKKQVNINTMIIFLVIVPISYFAAMFFDNVGQYYLELNVIMFALPFAGYLLIYSTSLRAFEYSLFGQFIESILQSSLLFIMIAIAYTFFENLIAENNKTFLLVIIFVTSWVLSYLTAKYLYKKNIKLNEFSEASERDRKLWKKDSISITSGLFGGILLGRSDIFLLAFLVSSSDVGAYFLTMRIAEIFLFFSTISYYVWAGEMSNQFQRKNIIEVQSILNKMAFVCFLTSLTIAPIMWFYAKDIILFISPEYAGYVYLLKFSIVIYFIIGTFGLLPQVTYLIGEHQFIAKMNWLFGLTFFAMILAIVPFYGLKGCLFSFAFCHIAYLSILYINLYRKHKLNFLPVVVR